MEIRRNDAMRRVRLVVSALLLIGGAVMLQPHGDLFDPSHLLPFWCGAAVMGTGFALSWSLPLLPRILFWTVAVGCRLVLLPMAPVTMCGVTCGRAGYSCMVSAPSISLLMRPN